MTGFLLRARALSILAVVAWAAPLSVLAAPECPLLYESVGAINQNHGFDLREAVQKNKSLRTNPEFVKRVAKVVESVLAANQPDRYNISVARDLVEALGQEPQNRNALLPALKIMQAKVTPPGSPFSLEMRDLVKAFVSSKAVGADSQEMMELLFRNNRKMAAGALTLGWKYIKSRDLKNEVRDSFLEALKTDERGHLHFFASVNKPAEFKQIPVALGVSKSLEPLSRRVRGVNYKEWEYFRWVADAKAIGTFKKAFATVVGQTSAVHFELGPLLKDLPGLKAALAKVKAKGDTKALKELKDTYEKLDNPKLGGGEISITSVELFWILNNPQYLKKTTFYQRI